MAQERKVRSFIAIALPDELESKLSNVVESLKEVNARIKCVSPENIHLTLRFLGYPEESKLKDIEQVMEEALKDIQPFEILLKGIGAFPNPGKPKVIWAGVETGAEEVCAMREKIEKGLNSNGIAREKRPYHAHLTIGRVKSLPQSGNLAEWLKSRRDFVIGTMKVFRVVLMESRLRKEGPEYFVLKSVVL